MTKLRCGFDKASGPDKTVTGRFKNGIPIMHVERVPEINSKKDFDTNNVVALDLSKIEERVIANMLKSSKK
jgi:hypothetical protein